MVFKKKDKFAILLSNIADNLKTECTLLRRLQDYQCE